MLQTIEPATITESLMYAVKRVEAWKGDKPFSYGTGWMLTLPLDDKSGLEALITNKHVLEGSNLIKIAFHATTDGKMDGEIIYLEVPTNVCVGHPSEEIDLAMVPVGAAYNSWASNNPGRGLFWIAIEEKYFISDADAPKLDACEPIIMVGCPSGLWDEANGFPLFRRGVTASHPAVDFNGSPEFAIDIGVYSGSSGSPVFLFEQGLIKSDKASSNYSPGGRFSLLGTLWGGPRISEAGELRVEPIPTDTRVTVETGIRMHLGYVVKVREVTRLAALMRQRLGF